MKRIIKSSYKRIDRKSAAAFSLRIFCFGILLCSSQIGRAQVLDLLAKDIKANNPKPLIRLDTRNSFIANQPVRMFGVQGGLAYGKNLQIGMGFHTTHWAKNRPVERGTDNEILFQYLSFFTEYRFLQWKKFDASYALQLGVGSISTYKREDMPGKNHLSAPYEALLAVQYYPHPTFSFGVGLGYRVLLMGNRTFDLNFNSPIYTLKFNLYFDRILALIKQ